MNSKYQTQLNFLPVVAEIPYFHVYRAERSSQDRPIEASRAYSLPVSADEPGSRLSYWVSFTPGDGLTKFEVGPDFNRDLTRWALFEALRESVAKALGPNKYSARPGFISELSLAMRGHPEGDEVLVLQPYFLRAIGRFGLLSDFRFRLGPGVAFNRRVQQLSLSLDRGFRRNLDYYAQRWQRVRTFVDEQWGLLSNLQLPGAASPVYISKDFVFLPARQLGSRTYIFGNGRESKSQFSGLRESGPLKPLDATPTLLFAFREQDRGSARKLAIALRGNPGRERFTFPGFRALFKTDIVLDPNPIVLPDFSQESMANALNRVRNETGTTLPVFVMPEGDHDAYLTHKSVFTNAGIPTQVCTLPVIDDETTLKWSIANIALQIFCKAGGQPWKVRPASERSLIIGVSQSHKAVWTAEGSQIERYLAFSVLTDSSGLFQKIEVLGQANDEASYLAELQENLRGVISDSTSDYQQIALHTSFKLRFREIAAIQNAVASVANDREKCRFSVLKVNHHNRFFGVNPEVNSLVPYEATSTSLGNREYLIWFEGIFRDRPTVTKAFPGPTHIQFLSTSSHTPYDDAAALQDLLNLSGANWRGFNAKSAPVSVFYCHLVADIVHEFHQRGLPLPAVHDLKPWFL